MTRWLSAAHREAAKSTHPKHALGAVIVRGGRVLARAANTGRWHGHAERRALRRGSFPGATLVVVRSNGGCSKPCPECAEAIRKAGIRRVVCVGQGREH